MSDYRLYDDGEQIVVYANRPAMLRRALMMTFLVLCCLLCAGSTFILPQDPFNPSDAPSGILLFGCIACLFAALALLSFVRSMRRSPTLVVNASGIADYCSSIVGGMGPLPWKKIAWVGYEIHPGLGSIQQFLIINLFQSATASAHRPMTEIPSPSAPYPFTTTILSINEDCLNIPVAELVYEIERYIKVHVPPGWHGALSDERRDSGRIVNPPVM